MLTFLLGHMPNPLGAGLLVDLVDFAAKMFWPIVGAAAVVCPEKAERFAVLIYSLLEWSRAAMKYTNYS